VFLCVCLHVLTVELNDDLDIRHAGSRGHYSNQVRGLKSYIRVYSDRRRNVAKVIGMTQLQAFYSLLETMLYVCRYRNFRTFTSPECRPPCQYSCLTVDISGEVVVAGTLDSYEIYVWSMQTGRLLEVCNLKRNYFFVYSYFV